MQLLHILNRVMHNKPCATGRICLREVVEKFPRFALECESSEHSPSLLLLFNLKKSLCNLVVHSPYGPMVFLSYFGKELGVVCTVMV